MSDLDRIERFAQFALNDAISIWGAVRLLRSRPIHQTKAEAALRNTETELESALDAVRRAMAEFSSKPVGV